MIASEQAVAKAFLLQQWGKQFCRCGIKISILEERLLHEALADYPSIKLETFIAIGQQSLAILKLSDNSVLDSLLAQPWLIGVDKTKLRNL